MLVTDVPTMLKRLEKIAAELGRIDSRSDELRVERLTIYRELRAASVPFRIIGEHAHTSDVAVVLAIQRADAAGA